MIVSHAEITHGFLEFNLWSNRLNSAVEVTSCIAIKMRSIMQPLLGLLRRADHPGELGSEPSARKDPDQELNAI